MQMMLLYENGLRVEAVLLAEGDYRLRVVVRGAEDATELRLIQDQWMSEEGEGVDIESILAAGEALAGPAVRGHAA